MALQISGWNGTGTVEGDEQLLKASKSCILGTDLKGHQDNGV